MEVGTFSGTYYKSRHFDSTDEIQMEYVEEKGPSLYPVTHFDNDDEEDEVGEGISRVGALTNVDKRLQLVKMLCLTVLPILVLWAYSVYTLTETINKKTENEKTKEKVKLSVDLGKLIHHLQQERDMSVLYLSALGPETKTFLLAEYIETDRAIYALSEWPANLDNQNRDAFTSKDQLKDYLSRHRQVLSKNSYDLNLEIDFYTKIIDVVIVWLYKSITQGKFAEVWKTLVAYLKLTSGKQDIGIERALGTLFYVQGGFSSHVLFENYNNRINRFKAFHTTAELYSSRVDRLYTSGVQEAGGNLTGIINSFRHEIQHYKVDMSVQPDIQKARFWFDNMTLYLDTLLNVQRDLGYEIIKRLDIVIDESTQELTISAVFLVIVLLMCPLVIFATENLTNIIQKYSQQLVLKKNSLKREKSRIDEILHAIIPAIIVEKLKHNEYLEAEYFPSFTIMFVDIADFEHVVANWNPQDVVMLIKELSIMNAALALKHDITRYEKSNDTSVFFSGLPRANKIQHVFEIANFALEYMEEAATGINFRGRKIYLRIGINTGSCIAGLAGNSYFPRFVIIGESVKRANYLKNTCCANMIHISDTTYNVMRKRGCYKIEPRTDHVTDKKTNPIQTYWLKGRYAYSEDGKNDMDSGNVNESNCHPSEKEDQRIRGSSSPKEQTKPQTNILSSPLKENTIHIQSSLTVHLPSINYNAATSGISASTTGTGQKDAQSAPSKSLVPSSNHGLSSLQSAQQGTVMYGQKTNICDVTAGKLAF